MVNEIMKCVVCKNGETKKGTTTVTFDRDGITLVVKEVPAQVCTNCGEDYVDGTVTREILSLAELLTKPDHKSISGDMSRALLPPADQLSFYFFLSTGL
jgi:YgiT-type zinc finger domain-containing protein